MLRLIISSIRWGVLVLLIGSAIAGGATYKRWWPWLTANVDRIVQSRKSKSPEEDAQKRPDSHHSETQKIEVNAQALANLGLTSEYLKPLVLGNYQRTIAIPAIVMPRPGRTQIRVSSPLSGVVTHVHAVTGQAVLPGELLFKVRLTYEDLVETQTQFLKSVSELEVENREIARLEQVVQSGGVPAKSLLERRYAKDKLEAYLASLRESLKLHGLSAEQIKSIEKDRKLLRDLTISAPNIDAHDEDEHLRLSTAPMRTAAFPLHGPPQKDPVKPLIIEELKVEKGQGVTSGELLCTLSDYSALYIEGRAFEQDAPAVATAAEKGWTITAIVPSTDSQELLSELKLAYVANSVDSASRTLSFFVELPNQILRDENRAEGQRFISWKYRIGQRLQLLVPVEVWEQQIILPVEAVVKDGADWFVFQQNGGGFTRVPVHVQYRDQNNVVIENNGAINLGDVIAHRSAHQLQMAIKNNSGGGADPHAGHTH